MKLTERDKKLLLVLLFLALFCIPYFFVLKPMGEENRKLEVEIKQAQERNSYLISLAGQQEFYLQEAQRLEAEKAELLKQFPEGLTQESMLLFLTDVEDRMPVSLYQVVFGADLPYDMGSVQTVQAAGQGASGEAAAVTQDQVDAVDQAAGTADTQAAQNGNNGAGMADPAGVAAPGMTGVYNSSEYNFSTNYEGLKEFLDYILNYRERMVITNMDIAYVEAGNRLEGTFTLLRYAVYSPGRETEDIQIPGITHGTTNVFQQASGTGGAEEPREADFFLMLSQPDAEGDAKVFGRSQDAGGETYLTSDSNDEQEITITFSGAGGKYTAECKIGSREYEEGIMFDKDGSVNLEIISSPRASGQDKSGALVHLYNNMDTTLNVTVMNDDADNPRVNIRTKEGTILMHP